MYDYELGISPALRARELWADVLGIEIMKAALAGAPDHQLDYAVAEHGRAMLRVEQGRAAIRKLQRRWDA